MRTPILLLLCLAPIEGLNILVYNIKFFRSHSNYMGSVADILVDAGHNVTSLIPELNPKEFDGTIKSTIIRTPLDPEAAKSVSMIFDDSHFNMFTQEGSSLILNILFGGMFGNMLVRQCDVLLNDKAIIQQLTDQKFDVLIAETMDFCGIGLHHVIQSKSLVSVSTTPLHDHVVRSLGMPSALAYNPSWGLSRIDPHSVFDRIRNVYDSIMNNYVLVNARDLMDARFKERFGADFPGMERLVARSVFHFTNNEPLLDFARPILPKVVYLGGLGAKAPKALDEEWMEVLSRRPVNILLSFGSIALSINLPRDTKTAILKALKQFPNATFIWKYEDPEDDFAVSEASKVDNVVLSKWTPQNDLLGDPRLSLFISHGGAGSTFECALRGKPGIFIPVMGDQPRNAGMMEQAGMGVVYSKYDLPDTSKLAGTIQTVLEDPKYAENAKRIAHLLHKRPFTPAELLVRYVQFAGESGPIETMIPSSLEQSLIEYYMIDAIVVVGFFVLSIVASIGYLVARKLRGIVRTVKTKAE